MLRIRLSRTGRKNYPAYRIVVAEHSAPIKGKFIEIVGHYIPNREPKVLEYDEKKIRQWISKGAKPTDTVASLLKNAGVSGMDAYIEPKDKKRKKKKEMKAEAKGEEAPAEGGKAAEGEEAPAKEKKAPAKGEEKAVKGEKAAEEKAEAPAKEKPPAEAKPEKPAEQPKPEEKPAAEPKPEEPKPEETP